MAVLTVISFILALVLIVITIAQGAVSSVRTAYSSDELGEMLEKMDYAEIEIFVDGEKTPLYELLNSAIEKYSAGRLNGEFTARIVNSQLERSGVIDVLSELGGDLAAWMFEDGAAPKLEISELLGNVFDNLDGETLEILRSQNITGEDVTAIVKKTVGDIDLSDALGEIEPYRVIVSGMTEIILWAAMVFVAVLLFFCGRFRPEIAAFYFGASWTIGGIVLLIVKFVISTPLKVWLDVGEILPESTYATLVRPLVRSLGDMGEFFAIAGVTIIVVGVLILAVRGIIASARRAKQK